jgi:HSP20 family protein
MIRQSNCPKECLLYPGEYTPLPETELLFNKLRLTGKQASSQPPLNMDEFNDHFSISVVVPGIQREDIYITVRENLLTIAILRKQSVTDMNRKNQIHEFDNGLQERHLLLPSNADSEFVSAEYNQGILNLQIPKSKKSLKTNNDHIAVY